jgi:hypothetical protein
MAYEIVIEDVPPFVQRVGDQVFQGSNNTIIVLGRDRAKNGPASINDGLGTLSSAKKGQSAGAIHMIAGRAGGDPDFSKDDAFIYLSMHSRVDENLGLENVESASNDVSALVGKSESVRLVFKKDIKIAFDGGKNYIHVDKDGCRINIGNSYLKMTSDKIVVESGKVELGAGSQHKIILGDNFKTYFLNHIHPTGVGPSGKPIDPWVDSQLFSGKSTTE